ncbi:MAG: zinc dependent phospholipase C family protein [Candidatus Wallbacteria bacterium]|nr:zinc dependent phospholipase C family protein [Candidatus Wallbacteria bacterium]
MWSRATAAVFLLAAVLAPSAGAWGPFTHVAIGRAVLVRARAAKTSPLSFLQIEPNRSLFLAASMGPDLTFSVAGFGKTDRAFDRSLHDGRLGKALLAGAIAKGGSRRMAFALGWNAHLLADRVMRQPGSVIYRNVFELKPQTMQKLAGDIPGILKITIDAIRARQDPWILTTLPRVDVPQLVAGMQQVAADGASKPDAKLEARLAGYAESFADSLATLREICRTLAANKRAFPDLASELTDSPEGKIGQVPGMINLERIVHDRLAATIPAGFAPSQEEGAATEARPATGFFARVTASLTRRSRAVLTGDGFVSRVSRGLLDGVVGAMNALGVGQERTRRARVVATYLGEMMAGRRDWPAVKAAVRAAAEGAQDASAADDEEDRVIPDGPP